MCKNGDPVCKNYALDRTVIANKYSMCKNYNLSAKNYFLCKNGDHVCYNEAVCKNGGACGDFGECCKTCCCY